MGWTEFRKETREEAKARGWEIGQPLRTIITHHGEVPDSESARVARESLPPTGGSDGRYSIDATRSETEQQIVDERADELFRRELGTTTEHRKMLERVDAEERARAAAHRKYAQNEESEGGIHFVGDAAPVFNREAWDEASQGRPDPEGRAPGAKPPKERT
jgi:hypothetical protein